MKKIAYWTIIAILAAAVFFVMQLDDRIKRELEKTLGHLSGVPVTIENVELSLFSGKGSIANLEVPNPKGFSSKNGFELGLVSVDADLSTIFSQPLVLNSVIIDQTNINLEFKETLESNLQEILEVSNRQLGIDTKSKSSGKKSGTTQDETSSATDETPDQAESENQEQVGEKEEYDPSGEYLIRINQLTITETGFAAQKGDETWSGGIKEIKIQNLGGEDGISSRAIGITVVRKLVSQTLKQAGQSALENQVKTKVEEVKNKLIESLFKSD